MKVKDEIFRQYDIRGIADQDLLDEFAYHLGRAFGTHLKRKNLTELALGMDVRKSSPRLFESTSKGIIETGCNIKDIGIVPTPLHYFSIFHFGLDGGIMITGSHNPIEYNGFKMMKGKDTIYGEEIQELKKLIIEEDYENGSGEITEMDVIEEYIDYTSKLINPERKLSIIMDPGNGTAGPIATKLFARLGADVDCINCEPDGNFPNHLPDPTVLEYTEQLKKRVLEKKACMGMGYDGDADRIGIVDEKGTLVYGDQLLGALSKPLLKKRVGSQVLFDVKCSQGLAEWIEELGGKPVMWKTGHSLLKAKMKEIKCPIAGEMSGHIFIADNYYGFDDAIFVSARFYELVSKTDKKVSEIIKEMPYYENTPEIRTDVTEDSKWKIVEDVREHFNKEYDTIEIDGVRILFDDGWGLVRASNTQPVIVTRFEAKTKSQLNEIKNLVHNFIDEKRRNYS
ncbi:phosphomannomutase/phosphoglucomutase [candidate division WOR-3 bacterium]|jgi:phosphomannomutase/phosphoglucomutase|nr:phosphomannomutase/phosphoglucomutase [candidate division WOR-3 bacterium]